MSAPRRIQLSRRKGWRMPPDTVKVDRTTKWGNPFRTGRHGTRADCVALFAHMCCGYLCLTVDRACVVAQRAYPTRAIRAELRGKNLACWCPLDGPCHADVLLRVANPAPEILQGLPPGAAAPSSDNSTDTGDAT